MNCPVCDQPIREHKPRKAKPTLAHAVDVATMSDTELYAHYKRTAPAQDLAFWLTHATLTPALRAGFVALDVANRQTTIPRTDFYRQLTALQALWRRASNARERQAHLDAGELLIDGHWTDQQTVVVVPCVFGEPDAEAVA